MKVLVTDGNSLLALAITRSLGKAGHEVMVSHQQKKCLSAYSKYSSAQCIYPNPALHPDAFIKFLLDFVEFNKIEAIVPVTEITTLLISKHKRDFELLCQYPFGDYNTIEKTSNKANVVSLADSLHIDIPQTIILDKKDDLDIDAVQFPFPVVIKPARSRVLTDRGWLSTSVTYANDPADLKARIEQCNELIFPILIQERIHGPGMGVFICMHKREKIAAFSHKRLREKPPAGGVSVVRQSVDLDPLAVEFSTQLLSALDWQGVAMVEFKVDRRDNRPKLMEINGRFWGSLQLAIDSGVNFPKLLLDALGDHAPEKVNRYKLGIKSRWLWGDIDAFLIRMLKSSRKQQLPPNVDNKIVYLLKFLILWEPKLYYDVLKFYDIKPWLFESYQWLKSYLRRLSIKI